MTEWAAKVLADCKRWALVRMSDPVFFESDKGELVKYADALAAIEAEGRRIRDANAKLAEGDGLVERLLAERSVISTTRTFPSGDERDMVLVPQYGPNPLATEAAAHIAALTAERDSTYRQLARSDQENTALCAKVEKLREELELRDRKDAITDDEIALKDDLIEELQREN